MVKTSQQQSDRVADAQQDSASDFLIQLMLRWGLKPRTTITSLTARHNQKWQLANSRCLFSGFLLTHLTQRKHHEGAAAAGVHDHGHEFGVDGAEVAVPGHLGDADVVVALVSLQGLAEDVAELAGPHDVPGHGGLESGEDTQGLSYDTS